MKIIRFSSVFILVVVFLVFFYISGCSTDESLQRKSHEGQRSDAQDAHREANLPDPGTPGTADRETDTENADPVRVISEGEEVELTDHTVDGHHTVVLFRADWSPVCKRIIPSLEKMAREKENLIVRYVDITDIKQNPDLPVAAQYGVKSPPVFFLYDKKGRLSEKGPGVWQTIRKRWGN